MYYDDSSEDYQFYENIKDTKEWKSFEIIEEGIEFWSQFYPEKKMSQEEFNALLDKIVKEIEEFER